MCGKKGGERQGKGRREVGEGEGRQYVGRREGKGRGRGGKREGKGRGGNVCCVWRGLLPCIYIYIQNFSSYTSTKAAQLGESNPRQIQTMQQT